MTQRKRIELGDQVKDPVTGISGLAYVRLQYLQGCDRIGIQGPTITVKNKAPEVPDLYHVDEPQLDVVKRSKVKTRAEKVPGGPSFFSKDTRR